MHSGLVGMKKQCGACVNEYIRTSTSNVHAVVGIVENSVQGVAVSRYGIGSGIRDIDTIRSSHESRGGDAVTLVTTSWKMHAPTHACMQREALNIRRTTTRSIDMHAVQGLVLYMTIDLVTDC